MALPAQRSVIFVCTLRRYHANGKSEASSVIVPAPCGEPSRRPSGGGGGVERATRVSVGVRSGAGFGVVGLVIDGSSLSPARGVATGRGRLARSGSDGSSRVRGGISGAGVARGVSRCGSSAGRVGSGFGTSSDRAGSVGAGVAGACGEPTAATAGTRLTT